MEAVIDIRNRLREKGTLAKDGTVVVTHFSHNIGLQYDHLTNLFVQEGILVAYDGMVIDM